MSKKSDDKLISELFNKYKQMMFKVALGVLHNKSDAEDAVQNSFLWIINNISKVSQIPCHERGSYFASITEHRAIDIYRERKAHQTEDIDAHYELSSGVRVDESALANVTVDEIKDAMSELSNRDYQMLYLYLFKGLSPKEIGEAMGISENSIRKLIQRARKRFAKALQRRGITYDI